MQQSNQAHENLVAPGPIVPTCRPSSQSSRRAQSSMSVLSPVSTQDLPPPRASDAPSNNEPVPELVQLFQAHSAASLNSSQSTGARELIEAGRRRLRQLAQRQKKVTEPKAKAEEASRQLLALQQEGFLPAKSPKRSAAKKSIDSTFSSAVSTSNLSFKSSSKRDVEKIGQPWLAEPLDSNNPKANQFSSVDLRQLTSLVEAAVSSPPLEHTEPPPFKPRNEARNSHHNHGQWPSDAKPSKPQEKAIQNSGDQPVLSSTPDPEGRDGKQESLATGSSNETPLKEKDQPEKTKPANPQGSAQPVAGKDSTADSTSQAAPNPASHTLKLFPDTLPPRVSSRCALRLSPAPNKALPAAPAAQKRRDSSVPQSGSTKSKRASNISSKDQDSKQASEQAVYVPHGKLIRNFTGSPIYEKFPNDKKENRPSSLQLGVIGAFPLPAPKGPLPSLPESSTANQNLQDIDENPSRDSQEPRPRSPSLNRPSTSSDAKDLDDRSRVVVTEKRGRPSSSSRLVLRGKDSLPRLRMGSENPTLPDQSQERLIITRGQSRADKVRALRLRDLSASRLYLDDSDSLHDEKQHQDSSQAESSQTDSAHRSNDTSVNLEDYAGHAGDDERCLEKVTEDPSIPRPLSPKPSMPQSRLSNNNDIRKQGDASSKLSCSPLLEGSELSSFPLPSMDARLSRSNSTRSSNVGRARFAEEQNTHHRPGSPMPSSDEEGTHKFQPRRAANRRRTQQSPLPTNESGVSKMRKSLASDPSTPQTSRNTRFERTSPQSPNSQGTQWSQDSSHGSRQLPSYVLALEKRIAHLEHQNRALQAALLAALDVGNKANLEDLLGGSTTSLATSGTERSYSSSTNSSGYDEPAPRDLNMNKTMKSKTPKQRPFRPESWIASPGSSRPGSCDTKDSASVRELEEMIKEFDFGWMSDK